ncbi:MAG: hypothetical protein WBX27_02640 [Specibacter sp.]
MAKDINTALLQVPGVTTANTRFLNTPGMSSSFSVRITAAPDASLKTVLGDSLRAFADSSGSTKGTISVAFYVFVDGAEDDGVGPDALGLPVTPNVDDIRQYTDSHQ